MAIDVYLQIDGIKGESKDERHKDWIECEGVHWGLEQPRSAVASTSGGHTIARAEMQDITLSKLADLSSPILAQHCAMGKTIPKAKFEFMRADGHGKPIKYFEVELTNVLIGAMHPSIENGGFLREQVSLKFSKVNWTYTQQLTGGGAGGSTVGGWDLAANKVA